jgi:hypothetical protein
MFEEETEAHWKYIEQLLKVHGEVDETIVKIKFHYKSAMVHGYKHGYKAGRGMEEIWSKVGELPAKEET